MASTQPAISGSVSFEIKHVETKSDLEAAVALIIDYTNSLGLDLSYQGLAEEIASMPGKYSQPARGCLLLARKKADGECIGCVALRAATKGFELEEAAACCEMKRLYVAPNGRRCGLGRALAQAVIVEAGKLGYSEMVLDSLPTMKAAIALYESLGFERVDAYYSTPVEETVFLSLDLSRLQSS